MSGMFETLVDPIKKLIEVVSVGIGKIYEPTYIKKIADAKSYEIKQIVNSLRENSDVPVVYSNPDTGISIDSSDFQELKQRAQEHYLFQEISKQQNIESVVSKTYGLLERKESVSDKPIEQDWILRFFNSVEAVSDEQMQVLWATLLAGEISRPGSFSLRALETLRNMSKQEAESMQIIASCAIPFGNTNYICIEQTLATKYEYRSRLFDLYDCNIIENNIASHYELIAENAGLFMQVGMVVCLTHNAVPVKYSLDMQRFTTTGNELIRLVELNKKFAIDFFGFLNRKYPALGLTVHVIEDDGAAFR